MHKFLKRLFCHHDYEVFRWHWTHGPNGYEPRILQFAVKCKKCGKLNIFECRRGSQLENNISNRLDLYNHKEPVQKEIDEEMN